MYTGSVTPRTGTRERILGVSKSLFAARGYEHSSTSSIARQAGTSESQLMKHFGSKAGLLDAIFTEGWAAITAEIRESLREVTSPREKLGAIAGQCLTALERDQELKMLMLLEGRRIRREGPMVALTEGFMGFVKLLDDVLEEMRAAGLLRPGVSPQAVRSGLMGMLEGMLRDRFLAERLGYPADFDARQVGEMLGITLASCILPTSAGAA